MVLQLAMKVWNSSGGLVGRCLKYLWEKRTMEYEDGLQNAELALFCKKMGNLCTRSFERQRVRVSGFLEGIKLVCNVCVSWFYQM